MQKATDWKRLWISQWPQTCGTWYLGSRCENIAGKGHTAVEGPEHRLKALFRSG